MHTKPRSKQKNRDKGATNRQTCNHDARPFPKLLKNFENVLHSVFSMLKGGYLSLSFGFRGCIFTGLIYNKTLRTTQQFRRYSLNKVMCFIGRHIAQTFVLDSAQLPLILKDLRENQSATKLMNRSFRSESPLGPQTPAMDTSSFPLTHHQRDAVVCIKNFH